MRKRYFPAAIHTIDIWHVVERLWTAGGCFFKDGSSKLKHWVDEQKGRLFDGEAQALVDELQRRYDIIPRTGPGNKGRRARLAEVIGYLDKRTANMDYGWLREQDLEIASGCIEGAIKYVIGRRLDHGGMRWIKERAEAVLQLRCIAVNGDWKSFERYVHDHMHAEALVDRSRVRLQTREPDPLPKLLKAA